MFLIKNKKGGFTLVEIMVATSIFIIVMFIAMGAILSLVDGNRRARAFSSVVSNLNISLDSMVRDIRTGTNYNITSPTSITFDNSDGISTTYSLVANPGNSGYKSINKFVISGVNGAITAPEVLIDPNGMTFTGSGTAPAPDPNQPKILLQIKGTVGIGKYASPFTIQTLISQRVLDI